MMRTVLSAALALVVVASAAAGIPWRTAQPSDSVAKSSALSETWELRAIAPDGRRPIVVRFWTKGSGLSSHNEWLWYARGRGVADLVRVVLLEQTIPDT